MSSQSEQAINEAVRDCLARCAGGKTPLGVIAEYIGELRDAGWERADILAVEAAARKVFAGIVRVNPESNLAWEHAHILAVEAAARKVFAGIVRVNLESNLESSVAGDPE